jgi:hypothetical protein
MKLYTKLFIRLLPFLHNKGSGGSIHKDMVHTSLRPDIGNKRRIVIAPYTSHLKHLSKLQKNNIVPALY